MLPLQFFGQNLHFALNLFAALVFFAVFWLYFDAWTGKRQRKELINWLGFLFVAISFLVSSTSIEQSVLGNSIFGNLSEILTAFFRIVGYAAIAIGQIVDPLQAKPKLTGLDESLYEQAPSTTSDEAATKNTPAAVGFGALVNPLHFLPLLGASVIAGLYWRRATTGLERHLKPIALAFALLSVYELLSVARLWRESTNPHIAQFVASFGTVWITEQLFLFAGIVILGRWVLQYLTRRFMSQLFMIFTTTTLAIFLLTTVSFTFLLVNSVQKSSLDNLDTAASVLQYAIEGKKAETLANSESVAANTAIATAVAAKDHTQLQNLTSNFLHDKRQSSLIITSDAGQVLLRAENPDKWGDSLSSDSLIRRALIGQRGSSVSSKEDVLAPRIYISSASPIYNTSGEVVGSAVVSLIADNAFADGVKRATGLDSALYAGNVRSATTFVAPNGTTRWIGVKENDKKIQNTVLKQGTSYQGSVSILNRQYLAVYSPLKDLDNSVVGMLFIGEPQAAILQTAGRSVQLTFIVTAVLLLFSIVPAFLLSRYLARQLE